MSQVSPQKRTRANLGHSENAVKSRLLQSRGVAQPGSAPALGEEPPSKGSFGFIRFQCFQQLGESAFAQSDNPSRSTPRVLGQFWDSGDWID